MFSILIFFIKFVQINFKVIRCKKVGRFWSFICLSMNLQDNLFPSIKNLTQQIFGHFVLHHINFKGTLSFLNIIYRFKNILYQIKNEGMSWFWQVAEVWRPNTYLILIICTKLDNYKHINSYPQSFLSYNHN